MNRNPIEVTRDTKNVRSVLLVLGAAAALATFGSFAGSEIVNSDGHQVRDLIHVI